MLDFMCHSGTPHEGMIPHSGRYEWGSGKKPRQREWNGTFLNLVNSLRKEGMSDTDIAKGMKSSLKELRAYIMASRESQRISDHDMVLRLLEEGKNKSEIGRIMGKPESSIRSLLEEAKHENATKTIRAMNALKESLAKDGGYLNVGLGTEYSLGISKTKLENALILLKSEGYEVYNFKVNQLGTAPGQQTTIQTLCPPGTSFQDLVKNRDQIRLINQKVLNTDDKIESIKMEPPQSISSDRVYVNYAEDGGTAKDGLIELRPGVEDISLNKASYAQVRIAVDGTHYLKGMAIYSDNIPKGYDIVFNTNKTKDKSKLETMKKMDLDSDNPFGSTIKVDDELQLCQRHYIGKDGKEHLSALNVVREEGDWDKWSKNLASQMLSKQPIQLAKQQLGLEYATQANDLDEIKRLTNPSVKRVLLQEFADHADSAAVELKAAHLPGQTTKVILPIPSMKETEVYAPHLNNGDEVVLIRYPHAGQFEIPRLRVNNKQPEALKMMGNASDAIGISHKTAEQLSGADFDGDSVIVIPTIMNGRKIVDIKNKKPLKELVGFDMSKYELKPGDPRYEKCWEKGSKTEQKQMGVISNLITDMTLIHGGQDVSEDIARAVKHSMVIIDTAKHKLDYTQSYRDNGIRELAKKYQGKETGGASTIISRAKSPVQGLPEEKLDTKGAGNQYGINPKTGELMWTPTGKTFISKRTGEEVLRTIKKPRMATVSDARELMSKNPHPMEVVYADHANKMKALANQARLEILATKDIPKNPAVAKMYAKEIDSLNAKLLIARSNKPKENQAQLLANKLAAAVFRDNPNMGEDDKQKVRQQKLTLARARYGAKKIPVTFTSKEWEAVQAGAISPNKLKQLLNNADKDHLRSLATPKQQRGLTQAQIAKAKAMSSTYTLKEIAESLGVSPSTISRAIKS